MLELVAEGRSNRGAGERLGVTERAVRKHVTAIFEKLGLPAGEDDNRRILAVLAFLRPGCALARRGASGTPRRQQTPWARGARLGPSVVTPRHERTHDRA